MSEFLDDRELVVCLGKLESASLVDEEDRIISRSFKNIENKSFYTEKGIVKSGDYALNTFHQLPEEEFEKFKNQKFDEKKSILKPTKIYKDTYAVLIFKNIKGYPPHDQIIFGTKEEAVGWIKHNIQYLPLHSLNGKPKQFQSDDEYREFIFQYGMDEFFYNASL